MDSKTYPEERSKRKRRRRKGMGCGAGFAAWGKPSGKTPWDKKKFEVMSEPFWSRVTAVKRKRPSVVGKIGGVMENFKKKLLGVQG